MCIRDRYKIDTADDKGKAIDAILKAVSQNDTLSSVFNITKDTDSVNFESKVTGSKGAKVVNVYLHFAKGGVTAVQLGSILVNNKELRAGGIKVIIARHRKAVSYTHLLLHTGHLSYAVAKSIYSS